MKLKRLLSKNRKAVSIINEIIDGSNTPIAVVNVEDKYQLGWVDDEISRTLERHAIRSESETIGWVIGDNQATYIAEILSLLSEKETEKNDLLDEILSLYRQINMLFNLSDKLAASLDLEVVAKLTLEEASRLISATSGSLLMLDAKTKENKLVATFGRVFHPEMKLFPNDSIAGAVVASGRAEIINDVPKDTRYEKEKDDFHSLIYAPLKAKNKTIGGIILISEESTKYSAADLNLLNTLASQAAPAIENALFHERVLSEARDREKRLRIQIQELSIELDEVRQREKVAEITETEYFQQLRNQADNLRKIIGSS